jgi:hypothetical protein
VAVPITRYRASRQFLWAGLVALGIAVFSGWVGLRWPYAWISAGLALLTAILLFVLAFRPAIEIYESHLKIGGRAIPWAQIRTVDRVWRVPLLVAMTMSDKSRTLLIHSGDPDGCNSLLRHLRRYSREALIDGVPYRQFWGETLLPAPERRQSPPKRYPLLLAEDEAEVERLFQRLKSVGHIDPKSSDEK